MSRSPLVARREEWGIKAFFFGGTSDQRLYANDEQREMPRLSKEVFFMDSKGLWDDLLGTLRAERTAYHHLSTLLTQEHDALRRMASDLLLELSEKKKVVLSDLRDLDTRRSSLFEALLGSQGIRTPLDWLPALSKAQPPWGGQASAEFREVLKVARRVADQGRQNAELTHRGLGMVREALRLIHGGGNQEPTYEGSGEIRMPAVTSSLSVRG